MDCKETKGLIISYIDGELNAKLREEIRLHLNSCSRCGRLEERLRQDAVEPFRGAARVKAPEELWQRIKAVIETQPEKRPLADLAGLLFLPLRRRKPAFALATLMAVLIITVVFTRMSINPVDDYLAQQIQFISQLSGNGEASEFGIDDIKLGTSIEKYFL